MAGAMELEDDALARFRDAGDREPLDRFLREHWTVAAHLIREHGVPAGSVEDVFQDAVIALLRALPRYRSRDGAARAFFLAIVVNAARMHRRGETRYVLRKERYRREREMARSMEAPMDPKEGPVYDEHQCREVAAALEELPPRYRMPLRLRYHHEMPPGEIATVLGTSVNTIKSRLRRGLKRLRVRTPGVAAEAQLLAILAALRLPSSPPPPVVLPDTPVAPAIPASAAASAAAKPLLAGLAAAGCLAVAAAIWLGAGPDRTATRIPAEPARLAIAPESPRPGTAAFPLRCERSTFAEAMLALNWQAPEPVLYTAPLAVVRERGVADLDLAGTDVDGACAAIAAGFGLRYRRQGGIPCFDRPRVGPAGPSRGGPAGADLDALREAVLAGDERLDDAVTAVPPGTHWSPVDDPPGPDGTPTTLLLARTPWETLYRLPVAVAWERSEALLAALGRSTAPAARRLLAALRRDPADLAQVAAASRNHHRRLVAEAGSIGDGPRRAVALRRLTGAIPDPATVAAAVGEPVLYALLAPGPAWRERAAIGFAGDDGERWRLSATVTADPGARTRLMGDILSRSVGDGGLSAMLVLGGMGRPPGASDGPQYGLPASSGFVFARVLELLERHAAWEERCLIVRGIARIAGTSPALRAELRAALSDPARDAGVRLLVFWSLQRALVPWPDKRLALVDWALAADHGAPCLYRYAALLCAYDGA